ncbi:hypothetical protein KAR91_61420 [Candidatus Pacearchaeota archaeon]|nr:hypothetical protein [Candidatus Pacearchaeota archaeon]
MAKQKYLVMDPKHAMKVQLKDQPEAKLQNVPKSAVIALETAHAKTAVRSGKLKLYVAEEVKDVEDGSAALAEMEAAFNVEIEEAEKAFKQVKEDLAAAKKELTATKKKLKKAEKDLAFANA